MLDIIPDEPLQNKLVRNGFRLYFFQFLVAPAGYLIKVMVSRELSVEDVGLFYSMIGLITIISAYSDLGLTEALQYYLPHYFIDKEYSKAKTIIIFTWLMQFVSGLLIAGGLYFGADWLSIHYFNNPSVSILLQYFAIYFIIINLYQVISSLFVAVQHIKRQQIIDVVRLWTVVILTYVSVYADTLDLLLFTKRWLVGVVVSLLFSGIGLKKHFGWLFTGYPTVRDTGLIKKQRTYGLRILIGIGGSTLLGQVNQQFALYFFGAESAGYRSNYLSFYSVIAVFTGPFIMYLFPLLNELYKKGAEEKIKLLYRYLFIGIGIFGVVGGVLGRYFSEWAAVLLFGEKFRQSGVLFQYYAPFVFTLPLIGVLFQDIASRGMVKQRVVSIMFGLVVNIIASIYLVDYLGMVGLVYAHLLGNFVLVACGLYWRNKR